MAFAFKVKKNTELLFFTLKKKMINVIKKDTVEVSRQLFLTWDQ